MISHDLLKQQDFCSSERKNVTALAETKQVSTTKVSGRHTRNCVAFSAMHMHTHTRVAVDVCGMLLHSG